MAITNHERVGKALELLTSGLVPFIERELKSTYSQQWFAETKRTLTEHQGDLLGTEKNPQWEVASALATMWNQWNDVFRKTLGPAERSLVSELRDVRNKWAHQRTFSTDDAYRALDSVQRLLSAVSAASESTEVEKQKQELLRQRFDEQVRTERRRAANTVLEGQTVAGLKPWREVVTPHKDVASGRYQQAEFAADLWQVHLREGSDEYRNPVEFFRRTFLTQGLRDLLSGALRRLSGQPADPVIQLQTNFGGGKTHSMLALYHLFSGLKPSDFVGAESVFEKAGVEKIPPVKRVVIVGNRISPGNPQKKPDGCIVRTLWGEIAWQLGGKEALASIKADDEKATSPGDALRVLLNQYGPCLILIDEWVAYARQLHDQGDLPGGTFETQFTFAQTLTEAVKGAKNALLVVSLPASDTTGSPHTHADDVEVGGERGRAALDRLRNVIGRVESSWRPASAEEGFEIVRRRLFEPIIQQEQFLARDTVAGSFFDLYRTQHQEFPPECRDGDYLKRLKAAYPIHPEVFDRLYSDWSTLVKFQRTRGVLRLMAAVIHALWEKGDTSPLIMPAHVPISDTRVRDELTRYLSDNWVPVIEKDVDGPNSLPLRMDGAVPNLGKFSAARRVARTIYLGSAPTSSAANRGLEDRRVKLGCVLPGESAAIFGDALRRLSQAATYLYQDGSRYWYSTQPTVIKLAEDRAEQLKNQADRIAEEIKRRIHEDVKNQRGDFFRVHDCPPSHADIPDEPEARLVVLGVEYHYTRELDCPALKEAKASLESRGTSPRLCRNALVFLAPDKTRLDELSEAVGRYLAWQSIVDEAETLNLDPHQKKQAETQRNNTDGTVNARLPETYQWLIVPTQAKPSDAVSWSPFRLNGQDPLAVRASKKLKSESGLVTKFGGVSLRLEMDKIPLWRGNHVAIRQLAEDFSRYLYLSRLRDASVLVAAIRDGLTLLSWDRETFAYAESLDEAAKRYLGLRCGVDVAVDDDGFVGLLVKPDIGAHQRANDQASRLATPEASGPSSQTGSGAAIPGAGGAPAESGSAPVAPKRFYATVKIDATRMNRDAPTISKEVVQHLTDLLTANVDITLEIQAQVPEGIPENIVRTITENCRTLKFKDTEFTNE